MGDFRITIEAVGNHGCGRESKDGEQVVRCGEPGCIDCKTIAFVHGLTSVSKATLEHWPVPGAGCTRETNPGPIDNLITGTRRGSFGVGPGEPYIVDPAASSATGDGGASTDVPAASAAGTEAKSEA